MPTSRNSARCRRWARPSGRCCRRAPRAKPTGTARGSDLPGEQWSVHASPLDDASLGVLHAAHHQERVGVDLLDLVRHLVEFETGDHAIDDVDLIGTTAFAVAALALVDRDP